MRSPRRGEEWERLAGDGMAWRRWGPYLAERAWGTVREDYSADGDAWASFPFAHARSRAYRWSEDGLAGVCDDVQTLCCAFAFWNGVDPILKERIFGVSGHEGNHGEDAKELWWYLDSTPTHSFMRWRWLYPQRPFPYDDLVAENRRRTRHDPEYELVDTGVLDDGRFFDVEITWAKAAPDDLVALVAVRNAGPEAATIDVLPTLWFRNTWSWGLAGGDRPVISAAPGGRGALVAEHHRLGAFMLSSASADGPGEALFCENESNRRGLWGVEDTTPYPKDGIGDHVVRGAATVNPERRGTKAAIRHHLTVAAGGTAEIRLRLAAVRPEETTAAHPSPGAGPAGAVDIGDVDRIIAARRADADEFYAGVIPPGCPAEEAVVARQALAGMLWAKQFYHYDVDRWLEGDPAGPPPPASRLNGRNAGWRHLNNQEIISMPDPWEYPWYAAWDLAFHTVALAHVDPEFAKHQLILICREWYMHPNGQLPAYEWALGDVNPPVHAWAALAVFEIDGSVDRTFLARVFHKLLLNFTWWVNRKDAEGNNVFEGGFLGLDNIGPIDRSAGLPPGALLEQSDGTAWMGMYSLNLLEVALVLAAGDESYEDVATKFFEHFAYIVAAIGEHGLWDEDDGFYYDVLRTGGTTPDHGHFPLRVRSVVGLLPMCATATLERGVRDRLPGFATRLRWFLTHKEEYAGAVIHHGDDDAGERLLLTMVSPERLRRILSHMCDPAEFLSDHGLRALSAHHREHPFSVDLGGVTATVDYEPGESTTPLFGGNSNWRGPIWFPVNHLVIEALRDYDRYLGEGFQIEYPTGSGTKRTLGEVAEDLTARLIGLFLPGATGARPVLAGYGSFGADPALRDCIPFHEYFHGDSGAGLGASHQTGWTGLVADLIIRRPRAPR